MQDVATIRNFMQDIVNICNLEVFQNFMRSSELENKKETGN